MSWPDPLARLGPDIFVDVLANLRLSDLVSAERVNTAWHAAAAEHESRLWKSIAYSVGVERADIEAADALAATGTYPLPEYDMRPIATDINQLMRNGRVNWRYVVASNYRHLSSWARARCAVEWVTPYPNTVWRIKSAAEDGTVLCSSRLSGQLPDEPFSPGLLVVDRCTSRPLWSIPRLQAFSHLEAGAGYFVLNRAHDDPGFEVWRNATARARSTLLKLQKQGVSQFEGESHTDEAYDPADPASPLPRGHYEHYLTLHPPKLGRAYRMHIDREGTQSAAPVLATCATPAIYIWHLEEDIEMETIIRGPDDAGTPNYIELDDDFVFVCDDWQMHVYARETRAHIVSFPPLHAAPRNIARLGFPLSITEDFKAIPDAERLPGAAPVGRALARGILSTEAAFVNVIERTVAMIAGQESVGTNYGFSACHYTSRDLICTTEAGGVLIVRDYATVFTHCAQMDVFNARSASAYVMRNMVNDKRSEHVADNSIIIGLGTTVKQLATYRDHIVLATSFNVLVMDGREIPELPARPEAAKEKETETVDKKANVLDVFEVTPRTEAERRMLEALSELNNATDDYLAALDDLETESDDIEAMDDDLDVGDDADLQNVPATDEDRRRSEKGKKTDLAHNAEAPVLPVHVLLGNTQESMQISSCLQADARSIYLTYRAAVDFSGVTPPSSAARSGFGVCVKVWSFGA
ncbi:hypothetical protein CspeluHIS016_0900920 [Cutaneotrichosporon spelunceum]|uniref:F-box domain-containing protein n=1 Tax=Cutaneotrichosporon spelunceum TaxID=1672016 RepID=A0AAD3U0D3_9TREE|nr:hypothetical protein CspeluHIS016_0900920 [Cutaneotrichosporon spelunceum]